MVKIVAIGDSITAGFPYLPEQSWVWEVSSVLGIMIVNAGICGETTDEMLGRFTSEVVAEKPTHTIIMGGSNDAFMSASYETVQDNVWRMVLQAREKAIKPILGLPPLCLHSREEALLTEYRREMQKIAEEERLPVIDFYTAFREKGSDARKYLPDGVHPSLEGYRLMGEVAISKLKSIP